MSKKFSWKFPVRKFPEISGNFRAQISFPWPFLHTFWKTAWYHWYIAFLSSNFKFLTLKINLECSLGWLERFYLVCLNTFFLYQKNLSNFWKFQWKFPEISGNFRALNAISRIQLLTYTNNFFFNIFPFLIRCSGGKFGQVVSCGGYNITAVALYARNYINRPTWQCQPKKTTTIKKYFCSNDDARVFSFG